MTVTFQIYRLLDDGEEQSLGFFVNDKDAMMRAFDYYSDVRYPHAYVDYRMEFDYWISQAGTHRQWCVLT